jgi:hypothetical protein
MEPEDNIWDDVNGPPLSEAERIELQEWFDSLEDPPVIVGARRFFPYG